MVLSLSINIFEFKFEFSLSLSDFKSQVLWYAHTGVDFSTRCVKAIDNEKERKGNLQI